MRYWQILIEALERWAPSLATLAVTVLVVGLTHRLLRRRSTKMPPNAHTTTWAPLFVFFLAAIGVVTLILNLPIGSDARGQLLSLLGLLATAAIALSSTTFVGNAMAGLMVRTVGNFGPGDFLRVGDLMGRVSERGLLHTEIQTEDSDLTTIPNLYLIAQPVTVVRSTGTIVSATVSLGYDVGRDRAERALLTAAKCAGLEDPFVQVSELGDFAISYRTAGFLSEVKALLSSRSQLRACMLDELHAAGIEIVSPAFMNQRVLPSDKVFMAQASARPTTGSAVPEAKIFEKAEEAEATAEQQALVEAGDDASQPGE